MSPRVWHDGQRPLLRFRERLHDFVKPHYECLISLCAHDAPEFLKFQIHNILQYVPNCVIVLHINSDTMCLDEKDLPPNVWINPNGYHSSALTKELWLAFLSNAVYGQNVATFDRILFISSSCIFFRRVDWSVYPKNCVATDGYQCSLQNPTYNWWWMCGVRDPSLVQYARSKGSEHIFAGWMSGTMMPAHLLPELVAVTDEQHHNWTTYPYE
jgi:hypothetical protein